MKLFSKTYLLQSFYGSLPSLCLPDTRNSQGQFYIGQNCLVGNQVIALKNKSNGMVPVRIPVPVFVFFCGNTIDDQVSAVIPVQSSDNVQQGGLSRTTGSQDRYKLIIS